MIVILNGPPGCGKDTIAGILSQKHRYIPCSFKSPMWEVAKSVLTHSEFELFLMHYHDRTQKEEPQPYLNGMSPRQFFIHISENFVKPALGQSQFGKLALDSVSMRNGHRVVFSDGGFPDEVHEFAGERDVLLVRLHREGYDFSNDSRDYIEDAPVRSVDILLVDGKPLLAVDAILQTVHNLEKCNAKCV